MLTTRVERRRGEEHWFLSSTGPDGKSLRLLAGTTERIEVADTVHFRATAKPDGRGGGLALGFSLQAADGRGLSVYRQDRRVPVSFEVLADDGAVLGSGTMNYG